MARAANEDFCVHPILRAVPNATGARKRAPCSRLMAALVMVARGRKAARLASPRGLSRRSGGLGATIAMVALSCTSPPQATPPALPATTGAVTSDRAPAPGASQGSLDGSGWRPGPPSTPTEAARLLFQRLLDPVEKDEETSTILALVQIGKPASNLMIEVLADRDAKIASLVVNIDRQSPRVHIEQAAKVLGNIGRRDAVEPLMTTLKATSRDEERAAIALALLDLPTSPASIKQIQETFEHLPRDTRTHSDEDARAALARSFAQLMNPTLVPWLVQQANLLIKATDDVDQSANVQLLLLKTATKLMEKNQVASVKRIVDLRREVIVHTPFLTASKHLQACGEDIPCHLDKLVDPAEQVHPGGFAGVKAAYSLGALGNETTRAELVKRLPRVQNDSIREAVLSAIDRLSPNGDAATADALSTLLESKPPSWKPGNSDLLLPLVIARLRARSM